MAVSELQRRYEVVSTLGKGGFGTVYRARFLGQGGFTKQVAIKVLNENMEDIDEVAQRLRDEARMLGLLNHRAIVRVDRLAQFDGRWAVIMEYIEGVDLKHLVQACGGVPVGVALEMLAEVASALHAAFFGTTEDGQQLGVVHRDIKPENIFVTAGGEVKVLDFGIARANFAEREAATRDISFGSPEYMAPERFDLSREDREDPPSDIYSLGCVLFELLTGTPFGRTSPLEKRHDKNVQKAYTAMRAARVPEQVLRLVGSMVAYHAHSRPGAREVERLCVQLRADEGGELLRYWSERVIPDVRVVRESAPDGMMGTILVERADSRPQGHVPAGDTTMTGTRTLARTTVVVGGVGLVGMGVLLVLLLVAGVVIWQLSTQQTEPVASVAVEAPMNEPQARETTAPAAPDPDPDPDPDPEPDEPEQAAVQSAAPEPRVERPVIRAVQPEPEPEPEPEVASGNGAAAEQPALDLSRAGTVAVAGDADSVVFIGSKGRVAVPGRVPEGRYTVGAVFGGGRMQQFGTVEVTDGGQVTVRCDSLLGDCVAH